MQLVLLLLACASAPPPQQAPTLLVHKDGQTLLGDRPLEGVPGQVFPGPVDPRGTHALVVAKQQQESLWLVPLAGGPPHKLFQANKVRNPVWAEGGATLVFESDAESFRDLYSVAREGGTVDRITRAPHGTFEPTASANGRLAYGSSRHGNAEIYIDGRRMTEHPADDVRPRWAGPRLAWLSHREGRARVWTLAPNGDDKRPLRAGEGVDLDHSWHGSRAAVVVQTGPKDVDIHVYEADGTLLGVIGGAGVQEHPAWSPDGQRIAFTSRGDVRVAPISGGEGVVVVPGAWLPRWP